MTTQLQSARTQHHPPRAEALDALVIGGGLAGSAAAIELARAGKAVALVERSAHAHDKVCGEFLSGEAIADLHALGVDPVRLGAVPIDRVRLAGRWPLREAPLPFPALSLTRRVLDDALLHRAADAGALVLRERSAESLARTSTGWSAEVAGPTRRYTLAADHILLATGKHDLRGLPRPPGPQNDLVAFKMYFTLAADQVRELASAVELLLFADGYAGLQLVDPTTANLCCVVRKSRLRTLGGGWSAVLAAMEADNPHLQRRLAGAQPLLSRALALSGIPYGFVRREAIAETLWTVGDQAAVIPSFTGDGMALALHSGRLAAHMLLSGEPASSYQAALHEQTKRQVDLSTALSRGLLAQPQRTLLELAATVWPGMLRAIAAGTRLARRHRLVRTENRDQTSEKQESAQTRTSI
jgi:flavin-dependent dehydrogenase